MRRSHSGPPISASFVSSVMAGYEHYRAAAIEGIEAVWATPVAFERFGGRDSDREAAYLAEVSTRRFTWACSARATASRCPTLFGDPRRVQPCRAGRPAALDMVEERVDREGPQQSFFEAARVFDVTGSYSSPEDSKTGLAGDFAGSPPRTSHPGASSAPSSFRPARSPSRATAW